MSTTMIPSVAAKEWDEVRTAFGSSIMVDTALSSLAQNLDGLDWPFSGADERASTYLDFTYAELSAEFEGRGKPRGAELLVQILRETLSFDQPFGEMVKQTEISSQRENPMLKTLSRLQIPENYPISLTGLDVSTRELCELESVKTIGEFAVFAQNVSKNIIVEGTFRELLNALAHVDEKALARYLPLHAGDTGVHLLEAFVIAANAPMPTAQAAAAVNWFREEAAEWRSDIAADFRSLERRLLVIRDAKLQERVAQLIVPHFATRAPRKGAWSSFVSWIKA
ncbi:MAG: hypothetical protein ABIV50_09255 [Opitutus sp.]